MNIPGRAAVALLLVAAARSGTAAPAPTLANAQLDLTRDKVLYEIGYAHLDTQWRWTYLDTIGEYIPNTMHNNFYLFEKYPDYVFNFTGANRYRMMKEYYPADYAKVKQYIREGRWRVAGSSWEENDVNVPSSESTVRQILYGNEYFRKEFGKDSEDYMLPDCFGFPASLPTLFAHSGLKGFSTQKLTWGSAVGIPFNVGRWVGPDGKYVIAALDAGPYGATIDGDLSQSGYILDRINHRGEQSGLYVDYRYFGIGDQGGSPSEGSVRNLETSLQGAGPVRVVSGSSDQIYKDITPKQAQRLPAYKGDLELTQHSAGSLTSQAYMKRWNRKNELLVDGAERASVAADWLGGAPYPMQKLTQAWHLILGAQFHDILPGTSVPKAYEYAWNDEVVALNHSAAALTDAAGAVARAMDTRAKGASLVVYNPLSIAREDVVEATVPLSAKFARVYGPDGREVPSQVAGRTASGLKVLFLARVPSVGFATFDVRPSVAPYAGRTGLSVSKSTLQNARYKVTLNGSGDVAQIYDKAAKRNLLSGPAQLVFKFEEPNEYPAWNIDWKDQQQPPTGHVAGPATVRVVENGPVRVVENGPVRVALEVTRHSQGSTFVQTIRLAAGSAGDRVEWDNAIDWNTRRHTLKAAFPLSVSNEKATYNWGMGTIQRPTNNPRQYEVASHEWFDLTDKGGKYGVSVLEDSKFGSDKPNGNTLRLTLLRTPSSRSYEDENTQDVGHHQVLYALSGHQGDWRKGGTQWQAARLNQPLIAFLATPHSGKLGKSFSLLRLDNPNVAVSALKKAEDGKTVIVRLQELSGGTATVRVTAAAPIVSAREVNGQEQTIGKATLAKGALVVKMGGNSPRAFSLTLGNPPARLTPPAAKSLPLTYNVAAVSRDGEACTDGVDGKGHAIPAGMFPKTVTSEGILFRMAAATRGAKTAVACKGQKISLPGGAYRSVYILANTTGGDRTVTFRVDGRPVALTVQDASGYVGQWDNRVWERPANITVSRDPDGIYGLRPAYIKRAPIAWFATHRHTATGTNDIYAYAYLFKYRIAVPAGAKTLTLPNDPRVRVFAVTAANDANDDTRPAQYLYDTFSTPQAAPALEPAGGSFDNTQTVTVKGSLYLTGARLRYTTDGSTPTSKSPLYTGPITITRTTKVSVRAIGPNGPSGPTATATYNVKDTTPPVVARITALEDSPAVHVEFSEPVAPTTDASHFTVSGASVRSATLSADGRSMDLTMEALPKPGDTLRVNGIKDRSPLGNAAPVKTYQITPAAPAVRLAVANGQPVDVSGGSLRVFGKPSAVTAPAGTGLSLNGTDDAVEMQNGDALNPADAITITAWVNPADWNGNRRILQKGSWDDEYRLCKQDGRLLFEIAGVGAVTGPLPTTGAWHHVAATYGGGAMRLYLDGREVAHAEASGQIRGTGDPLLIGSKTSIAPATDHFKGAIADVRLYPQALRPEHIRALAAQR